MKVLIVNTYDRGGAANSCKRLHLALLETEIKSKVLLREKENNWPFSFRFEPLRKSLTLQQKIKAKVRGLARRLKLYSSKTLSENPSEFLKSRSKELEMISFPTSPLDITRSPLYKEADIINLHWVANFIDYESFFKKNKKPVVWTLHDMNAFTGGEHYEEDSLGLDIDGFPKKRKISAEEIRFFSKIKALKKRVLSKAEDLTVVAPSKWLTEEARKSGVFENKNILHIPYGLDSKSFYPKNREQSRKLLNIPLDRKVILFVSDSLKKNRKGFIFLKKAYEQLEEENLLLCAVGSIDNDWVSDKEVLELGMIKDEELMCAAYSAADVFVIPSLMDNLPNTVLESLMCGTPVIGFPVGGIPDMIIDGENGLLTEKIGVEALRETMLRFFKSAGKFRSEEIRKKAIKKYDSGIQAKRYGALFQNLLEAGDSGNK